MPRHAIDRLLTIDLDVNFSMNANKMLCKSRLFYFRCKCFSQWCRCEMSIWCTFLLSEMQFSWCRCPMQGCRCKVYPWWCQRAYLTVMQMSPYRDGDAKILWCKCLLMGMSWCKYTRHDANAPLWVCNECKCPLVGISWHKCFDANTNYSKIPFIFKTRLS